MTPATHPELLAPAGDRRALRAALAAGADAVYFGLERWSARAFAGNFSAGHAVEAVELAHLHGARAHLALNTLLKDDEVEPALAALEAPYAAGLDALIVADVGLAARVHDEYPGLPLHASTQLGTHSSAQLAVLADLEFARAILARELSLAEIAVLDPHGLELEAFVHGALCYGYSGDCLLSSMVGGRSGNRGRCSQACRMRYGLRLEDSDCGAAAAGRGRTSRQPTSGRGRRGGAASDGEAASRILSTADLSALGVLPRLLDAGIRSFKIEGRMKDPTYVAVTTSVYREALDAVAADPDGYRVLPHWTERLEQAFSRGFTVAHLEGRHHEVRSGGRGGHRGVLVGRVQSVDESGGGVVVRLTRPVTEGDTLAVYTPWGQTEPFRAPESAADRLAVRLRERVTVKDRVFRLAAAEVDAFARDLVAGRTVVRPVGVAARLEGRAGAPARLTLRALPDGPEVAVVSGDPLAPARRVALDAGRVRDALGALGGTPYRLTALDVDLDEGLFLPVGELKGLRRRAVATLDETRVAARRRAAGRRHVAARACARVAAPSSTPASPAASPGADSPHVAGRDLPVVLVVRPGDEPLVAPGVAALCLDLRTSDRPEHVRAAVRRLSVAGLPLRCRPPEVLFDADFAWWRAVAGAGWTGVYARHLGLLAESPDGIEVILEYPLQGLGDGALTVARGWMARLTTGRASPRASARDSGSLHSAEEAAPGARAGEALPRVLAGVVASPEASLDEIARLAAGLRRLDPPAAVEALVFGRQQVLHTRDQLGRAEGLYEAPGPDDHVALLLRDAKDYVFPAEVDATGTRLFNARVTNVAANLDQLAAAGVAACLVVQADMDDAERRAFAAGGLPALAPFATRERATTGHLFRGVA